MLIKDIISRINKLASNSSSFKLTYNNLIPYLDASVDHINYVLKTKMPTISEFVYYDTFDMKISKYEYYLGSFENSEHVNNYIKYNNIETTKQYIYYDVSENIYYYYNDPNWFELTDSIINDLNLDSTNYGDINYNAMPDDLIRQVLIYYATASYLEEEDEFEYQHSAYKETAENALAQIMRMQYSMYRAEW